MVRLVPSVSVIASTPFKPLKTGFGVYMNPRGDESWSASEVTSFAKSEADHAALVCSSLAIPMITLESPTPDEFEAIIAELLGAR
jgi:hypothetical protein